MVDLGVGGLALLALAGFVAGAVNGVAGGGSLVSFPALLAAGYPPVTANVTNQVAVLPGYVGGSVAYRKELRGQRRRAIALSISSVAGALIGAAVLVFAPGRVFDLLVPYLVLFACALLAAQPAISRRVRAPSESAGARLRLHAMQFAASVYGGYFGAGLGIVLLAVLALGVSDSLQRLNALKGLLSLVVAVVSVAFFAIAVPIAWLAALVMVATSYAGGLAGVMLARRLSGRLLRALVVGYGVAVGIWLLVE
jgi:uncharacterized protein